MIQQQTGKYYCYFHSPNVWSEHSDAMELVVTGEKILRRPSPRLFLRNRSVFSDVPFSQTFLNDVGEALWPYLTYSHLLSDNFTVDIAYQCRKSLWWAREMTGSSSISHSWGMMGFLWPSKENKSSPGFWTHRRLLVGRPRPCSL